MEYVLVESSICDVLNFGVMVLIRTRVFLDTFSLFLILSVIVFHLKANVYSRIDIQKCGRNKRIFDNVDGRISIYKQI